MKKIIGNLFKNFDMFYSTQLLRFSEDNNFKTTLGGFVSVLVFILISISLASNVKQTLDKSKFDITNEIQHEFHPEKTSIITGTNNSNFMFGISLADLNHNPIVFIQQNKRYFDVVVRQTTLNSGIVKSVINIVLQFCTKQHWNAFSSIQENFQSLRMNQWLCPTKGSQFNLQGVLTSKQTHMIVAQLRYCNNLNIFNNTVCASDDQISTFFRKYSNMQMTFYFSNPILNLGSKQNFINYQLYQQAKSVFSKQLGSTLLLQISDFKIQNDNSYMPFPFQEKQDINGIILDGQVQNRAHFNYNFSSSSRQYFAKVIMMKSPNSFIYTRTVQKISTVLSYVGGFFGALTTSLFILKVYTDLSLEMSIILSIFKKENGEPANKIAQHFNLIEFFRLQYYRLLQRLGKEDSPEEVKQIMEMQHEVNEQMDISIIIRRLINLEKLMTFLFKDQHLDYINLCQEISLQTIKNIKKKMGLWRSGQKRQKQFTQIKINKISNSNIQEGKIQQNLNIRDVRFSEIEVADFSSCKSYELQLNNRQFKYYNQDKIQQFSQQQSCSAVQMSKTSLQNKLQKLAQLKRQADNRKDSLDMNYRIWKNIPSSLKQSVIQFDKKIDS